MEYILMPTVTPIIRAVSSVLKKLMIIENPTPDEVVKTAILEEMLFDRVLRELGLKASDLGEGDSVELWRNIEEQLLS